MGHHQLQLFPKSRNWRRVVELLDHGSSVAEIAAAASKAAKTATKNALADPVFTEAFWILLNAPLAARGPDFVQDMAEIGVEIDADASLLEITAAIHEALDQHGFATGGRTQFGEFAQLALVEALNAQISPDLPSLFKPSADEARGALGRLSSGNRFGQLARHFFYRLLHRTLSSFLSRELAQHIGPNQRFADDAQRRAFDHAFEVHCRETSRIVEEYAGGWYGKHVWKSGGFDRAEAHRFASYAFTKLRQELERRNAPA